MWYGWAHTESRDTRETVSQTPQGPTVVVGDLGVVGFEVVTRREADVGPTVVNGPGWVVAREGRPVEDVLPVSRALTSHGQRVYVVSPTSGPDS